MKDYVLVFTEGADLYNLEKQLKFFPESKIVKINGPEDFSSVDFAIKEASKSGFKKFNFISSHPNWAKLDETIKDEYGHLIETEVFPAIFKRKLNENNFQQNLPIQIDLKNLTQGQFQSAPFIVFIAPFNLLYFNGNSTQVDGVLSDLASFQQTYIGKEKLIAKSRYFPIIPSSDLSIYGKNVKSGVTADQARELARNFCTDKKSFEIFTRTGQVIDDNDSGIPVALKGFQLKNSLSDTNYVNNILTSLGIFKLNEGDNAQTRDTVFICEPDVAAKIKNCPNNSQGKVYYHTLNSVIPNHLNKNQNFCDTFSQIRSSIRGINEIPQNELNEYTKPIEFSDGHTFDNVDNYLFQILTVNYVNNEKGTPPDSRNFGTNLIQNINAQQGWSSIGDLIKKGLLIDSLADDFKDTWGEWAIKGMKHGAKMATNAGGYRDQQLQKRADMMAAITPDVTKIKHPSEQNYYSIEGKNISEKEYKALPPKEQEKAKQIEFNDLPSNTQKSLLDNYQKKVNLLTFGFRKAAQAEINSKMAGERKNKWLSIQAHQQADDAVRQEKVRQAQIAISQCQSLLLQDREADGQLLGPEKKKLLSQLYSDSTTLINNIKSTDRHDHSENDGSNLTLYNQILDTAKKVGIEMETPRNLNSQISQEQAKGSKAALVSKQASSDSEKEELVLCSQLAKHQNYNQLRNILLGQQ